MINKLLVASSNAHKIEEIKDILNRNNLNIEILSYKDFDDSSEPIEDGLNFEENALIKANFYYEKYHLPTLADDSGITIDYFNNLPGIHSSRFLHSNDYVSKNNRILELMKNVKNRKASFIAVVAYIDEEGNQHIFKGINNGLISTEQKGDKGFGYDPIFLIEEFNKTEAELGEEYKNEFSHRAKAMKQWIGYVKK